MSGTLDWCLTLDYQPKESVSEDMGMRLIHELSFSRKLHFVTLKGYKFVGNFIFSSNTDTLGWWPLTYNSISPVAEEAGMILKNQLESSGSYTLS